MLCMRWLELSNYIYEEVISNPEEVHDDVIKCEGNPPVTGHKGQWQLWCFLWCAPEQTIEQVVEMPVIWDDITLIVTSL